MKFKFIKEKIAEQGTLGRYSYHQDARLEMGLDAESLDENLSEFSNFLRGAGFILKGDLTVDDEDYRSEQELRDQIEQLKYNLEVLQDAPKDY